MKGGSRHAVPMGFTLVEMLVALSLFAMLAVIGVGLLRSSIGTQDAVQARLQAMAGINRLRAIMGHDLAGAAARPTRGVTGAAEPAFLGRADGFALVSLGTSDLDDEVGGQPQVQRIQYHLAGDEWRRAIRPVLDGSATGKGDALMSEVGRIALRYRDRRGVWQSVWPVPMGGDLPAALEFTLTRNGRAPLIMRFLINPGPPDEMPTVP